MSFGKINLKNPSLRAPILIFVIGILCGYMWYQQFYMAAKEEIVRTRKLHKEKENALRTILALKPQLDGLKLELVAAQNKLDSLKNVFPDQKEVPKLINELTKVLRASGVVATKFNPLSDIEQEYYIENRYNISVTGTYNGLAEFFAFLANFKLIINLTSVSITASTVENGSSNYGKESIPTIMAMFEMTTFSSKK